MSLEAGTRLDRTVAVKVLPEHLAENAERKQRFVVLTWFEELERLVPTVDSYTGKTQLCPGIVEFETLLKKK